MPKPNLITQIACNTLISRVRFENAGLTLPGHSMDQTEEDTEAIRKATRLYTESWIVPLLEAIREGDLHTLRLMSH